MSLKETIERLVERLYAGFNIYAAISFQAWVLAVSASLIIYSMSIGERLSMLLSGVYWAVAITAILAYTVRQWRRYIVRLAAAAGRKPGSLRFKILIWFVAFLAAGLLAGVAAGQLHLSGENLHAFTLLLAITLGVAAMAYFEARSGGRPGPASVTSIMLALATATYPAVSPIIRDPELYAAAVILTAYSTATLLYLHAALRRIA